MTQHPTNNKILKVCLAYLGFCAGLAVAGPSLGLFHYQHPEEQLSGLLGLLAAIAGAFVGWHLPSLIAARTQGLSLGPTSAPSTSRPYVLDTSVIIDGRIADVVETKILDNPLIVPSFVLRELQGIADSSDKLRRARGRRGLDVLNKLRSGTSVELRIEEQEAPGSDGQPVDQKLVLLARHLGGKVVTGDYNLNKVARLHDVDVVNLNDLAQSLRPAVLPGETLDVLVVKPGEEAGQGIGYLDDGTMIVVEGGREKINETIKITVTSVLQTSAGRMIFGRV